MNFKTPDINQSQFSGKVIKRNPADTLRRLPSGITVLNFSLAIMELDIDRNGIEYPRVSFAKFTVRDELAYKIAETIHKGDTVLVECKYRSWRTEKFDKVTVYGSEFLAEKITLIKAGSEPKSELAVSP